jgi:hypothetical protein
MSSQVIADTTPHTTAATSSTAASACHGDTDLILLAVDIVGIVNVAAAVLGFAAIGGLVYVAARPDRDRADEDEARAHYDRHGRWPDD